MFVQSKFDVPFHNGRVKLLLSRPRNSSAKKYNKVYVFVTLLMKLIILIS
jgi:hypothetical protein